MCRCRLLMPGDRQLASSGKGPREGFAGVAATAHANASASRQMLLQQESLSVSTGMFQTWVCVPPTPVCALTVCVVLCWCC